MLLCEVFRDETVAPASASGNASPAVRTAEPWSAFDRRYVAGMVRDGRGSLHERRTKANDPVQRGMTPLIRPCQSASVVMTGSMSPRASTRSDAACQVHEDTRANLAQDGRGHRMLYFRYACIARIYAVGERGVTRSASWCCARHDGSSCTLLHEDRTRRSGMPGTPARHVALSRCPDQKLLYATPRYSRDALLAISCSDACGRARRSSSRGEKLRGCASDATLAPVSRPRFGTRVQTNQHDPGWRPSNFGSPAVA